MPDQRLERDVCGPFRRGQRADADVHLAVAQREDPAVARQHLAGHRPQFQIRGDPRLVGRAATSDSPAPPPRTPSPDATAGPARGPAWTARRRRRSARGSPPGTRRPAPPPPPGPTNHVRRQRLWRPAASWPRRPRRPGGSGRRVRCAAPPNRSTGTTGRASPPAPSEPNPAIRRPGCRMCPSSHGPRPSSCNSATARGVRPSPHVLSRGNVAASITSTSRPSRAAQAAAADPAGPAPTTTTSTVLVGGKVMPPSMLDQCQHR